MDYSPPGSSVHEILECFCHSLLQEIFLTEGSDPGLHCRQALYCLNHQGRPSATPHTDLGVEESCAHPERDRELQTLRPLASSPVALWQIDPWENKGPNTDLPESKV